MDAVRVALLREVLAGTQWPGDARRFAGSLRRSVVPAGGHLLLVGTEGYEPWHLAAHLVDEAAWSGLPELAPTLVRHHVRPGEPPHLSVGLGRLAAARRGHTLLVVAPGTPGAGLLERVHDARRAGATVLSLDGGDPDLGALAHDGLSVPAPVPDDGMDLDTVQHLVSAAAGENTPPVRRGPRRFGDRLARLADHLTAPPPSRW
ncbi:hypothetical protein Snoj_55520 [Streptomyces nojiriensis]|uniref:SIS domain-containing protein n=1 Tax=Streptomyces nojiriensis TaxID=66374 RepID=A0ABQ3SU14_9ACTN|nr:hypothetical protein [Streptomyces nojiriensis]QTI45178.1 hypothetical protein JYK04_02961 [Streptomyces nojiriensis]GGR94284.1 hypothetical protein GCM10010205_23770 [Streptomyces nojiriensis]GHI71634.1 hypothetical protein Snoj_55520 [Streptomyces nojiriensis]